MVCNSLALEEAHPYNPLTGFVASRSIAYRQPMTPGPFSMTNWWWYELGASLGASGKPATARVVFTRTGGGCRFQLPRRAKEPQE
jgi:hypothetical protein